MNTADAERLLGLGVAGAVGIGCSFLVALIVARCAATGYTVRQFAYLGCSVVLVVSSFTLMLMQGVSAQRVAGLAIGAALAAICVYAWLAPSWITKYRGTSMLGDSVPLRESNAVVLLALDGVQYACVHDVCRSLADDELGKALSETQIKATLQAMTHQGYASCDDVVSSLPRYRLTARGREALVVFLRRRGVNAG